MKHVLFAIFFAGILVLGFFYRVFGSVFWAVKAFFWGRGKDDSLYEEIFIAIIAYLATMTLPHEIGCKVLAVLYFVIVIGALAFSEKPSRLLVILSLFGFVTMVFGQDLFTLIPPLEGYALLTLDVAPLPLYVWLIASSRRNFVEDFRLVSDKASQLVGKSMPVIDGLLSRIAVSRRKESLAMAVKSE